MENNGKKCEEVLIKKIQRCNQSEVQPFSNLLHCLVTTVNDNVLYVLKVLKMNFKILLHQKWYVIDVIAILIT